jgi:hypothetical protein
LLTISIPQIIIGQHDHRGIAQIRSKQLFAAGVEVVAINECEYGFHLFATGRAIMTFLLAEAT